MADKGYLDWPFLDQNHRELAEALENWCRIEIASYAHDEGDVDSACRTLLSRLAAGGWLRYVVSSAYGGVHPQFDVRSLCLIRETLARHSGLADFVFAMQGLGSGAISLFGTDAQKAQYLRLVCSGERIAAFALTEPASGSDVARLEMTAREADDGYVLSGRKTFISNGGIADFYVVSARTGEAQGAKGISTFIVDADAQGLEVEERIEVMAPHPLATLRFDDVRVGADSLLGERGRGFAQAMATLDVFRTTVGAAALGFARRALDEATERVISRRLGDGALSDSPLVQALLAGMVLDIDTAALLIYRAAWLRDVRNLRNTREAALAKLHATEGAQRVIDTAVQLFGGQGVVRGQAVEALYREIRALRIYEGASEVQKLIIARQHLAGSSKYSSS